MLRAMPAPGPLHFTDPQRLVALLLAALALAGCSKDAFRVRYAPSFTRGGQHVSVFGIKRDGMLSPSGWAVLGPDTIAPFSELGCEVGFSDSSLHTAPALAAAISEYVRVNDVTDTLLDQLAPAAKGDTLLLLTIAGHPPEASGNGLSGMPYQPGGSTAQRSRMSGLGGGGGGHGQGAASKPSEFEETADDNALLVSARLFSVHEHRSVGLIELRYTGTSIDQALRDFTQRFQAELPGAMCSSWNWSALGDDAVHKLQP